MKRKASSGIMLAFLLIDVLTLAFGFQLVEAEPATREAGVYVGYRIDYGLSATWESNDPEATIPQYILDSQQLDYFYNVVQSVTGTNVTFSRTLQFQNGTERSETRWVDVDTGHAGTGSASGYLSFIAANLSAGDLLYTGLGPGIGEINETITRRYLGQPVVVNHVIQTTSSSAYFMYVDSYWNRATGALYELFQNHTGYDTRGEVTYATIETTHIYVIEPQTRMIPAKVRIDPKSLNLKGQGKWITAYIELPEGINLNDIDVPSMLLNHTISADPKFVVAGDHDNDSTLDLMVKFDRTEVISCVLDHITLGQLADERFIMFILTLSGKLNDGTRFQGSATIRVIL